MSEIPDEYRAPDQKDLNRLIQYLAAAVSDPIRVSVLLAHGLIEELIDEFIKELVPNHDFLDLPKTGFSDKLRWARRLDCEGRDEPFWKFITELLKARYQGNDTRRPEAWLYRFAQAGSRIWSSCFQILNDTVLRSPRWSYNARNLTG